MSGSVDGRGGVTDRRCDTYVGDDFESSGGSSLGRTLAAYPPPPEQPREPLPPANSGAPRAIPPPPPPPDQSLRNSLTLSSEQSFRSESLQPEASEDALTGPPKLGRGPGSSASEQVDLTVRTIVNDVTQSLGNVGSADGGSLPGDPEADMPDAEGSGEDYFDPDALGTAPTPPAAHPTALVANIPPLQPQPQAVVESVGVPPGVEAAAPLQTGEGDGSYRWSDDERSDKGRAGALLPLPTLLALSVRGDGVSVKAALLS